MSQTHMPLRRLVAALATAFPLSLLALTAPAQAAVVISQVYGGGGNTGATYTHDYVELFNAGSTAASVSGWSVQYASATGTSWQTTALPAVTLQPGQYLLVQQAKGTGGTTALPVADATGTIAMSGTAGKVALVSSTTALSGASPTANVIDLVGFGATASYYEGSAAAPAPSNTTAIFRAGGGCSDTGSNATDFSTGAPTPRNTASTLAPCDGSTTPSPAPTAAQIYEIQGSGATSPLAGQTVTTTGVVTKLVGAGFFLQALTGDGDANTSDGIFVYTGSAPTVALGQHLQLTATVTEYVTAGSSVTELTSPSGITVLATGQVIAPVSITLPATGDLERYEGMLVSLQGPLTVNQNYFQARYGQLTLSAGGRLETPTNRHRPGSSGAVAMAAANALRSIVLEDGSSAQNVNPTPFTGPTGALRGGDLIGSITGVIDYGPATSDSAGIGDYRIVPLSNGALTYTAYARPATPAVVGGNARAGSFNVLNYFTTFTDGSTADGQSGQGCSLDASVAASNCRGANSAAEFLRQRAKIVAAMQALDADVLGLMEIQNNGNTAVQNLVDALNAALGAPTYASIGLPVGGTGSDAIRVAMIYKPARLTPAGDAVSDTNTAHNRPPLAQTFQLSNGEKFTVIVNHFKSKGSCPTASDAEAPGNTDAGDGQGCWNARRVTQADALLDFAAQRQDATGSSDVLILGDLNAYAQEDPVITLTSSGYVDQSGRYSNFAYSYVFDGAAGRLDHLLASPTLSAKVTGATHWHINADESLAHDYNLEYKQPACSTCAPDPYAPTPYRSSDHDPALIGLSLFKPIVGTSGRDTLEGSAGDDWFRGGAGADRLTGGAGINIYGYYALSDAGDTITDFVPGKDLIDLRALLSALQTSGTTALSTGVLRLLASGSNTLIQIDPDGSSGLSAPRTLITLTGVSPTALSTTRDFLLQ